MIKHDLIEQVGGIEKAKAIVEGAPETSTLVFYFFDEINNELIGSEYYKDNGSQHFDKSNKSWGFCLDPQIRVTKAHDALVSIDDLRTAIAKHDEDHCNHEWNDMTSNGDKYRSLVCKNCDSTKNYLPLDEDHITNIHNHISPNMKVVEL